MMNRAQPPGQSAAVQLPVVSFESGWFLCYDSYSSQSQQEPDSSTRDGMVNAGVGGVPSAGVGGVPNVGVIGEKEPGPVTSVATGLPTETDVPGGGGGGGGKRSSFDRIVEKLGPLYPSYTRYLWISVLHEYFYCLGL